MLERFWASMYLVPCQATMTLSDSVVIKNIQHFFTVLTNKIMI